MKTYKNRVEINLVRFCWDSETYIHMINKKKLNTVSTQLTTIRVWIFN